ncbi:Pentatricopeptide repeat-containing protein MRL1 [Durusdinium trenchii]|uniref:Chloroplastic (Protein MATURATION OF RBCL 1) (AtMRL1) n=1 Tax=Durusdinium trenchii TaxID=1381693 RepID=A0ABP0RMU7_9DINO
MSACEKAAEWEVALLLLETAEQRQLQTDVISHNAAISACEKAGEWRIALHLFSLLPKPSVISYNALLSATATATQTTWCLALALLNEAVQQRLADVITFNAAISACGRSERWEEALELLRETHRLRLGRNVITFSAAVTACEKSQRWQSGLLLLADASAQLGHAQIDLVIYNAAISACEKAGEWQQAIQVLAKLHQEQVQSSTVTYGALISSCGTASEWSWALKLLEEMDAQCLKADVVTHNAAMSACGFAHWMKVLWLLEDLMLRQVPATIISYSTAITACEQAKEAQRALNLLERLKIQSYQPTLITFNSVLAAATQLGRWEEVMLLLEEVDAWQGKGPSLLVNGRPTVLGTPQLAWVPAGIAGACAAAARGGRRSAAASLVLVPHGWEPITHSPETYEALGEKTREVYLEHFLPAALRDQWQNTSQMVAVSAMATTTQGIEMLLALPGNAGTAQSFLSVYFPAGLDEKARPRARLVESQARQSSAGAVLPMGLPGGPTAGVIAVPFGSEGSMAFAGDEVSSRSVAHLLEGQAQEDGSKALWAFLPQPRPSAGGTSSWPGEEELTKVPEEEIKALVAGSKQPLPTERSRWRSKDVVCLGDELILRAMTDRQNDDWLEFVHLPSRSARQLPAASEGMDAGPVARLLAWPKSQLFQGDEEAREMLRGSCVVVFESGHVRWMEAHPQGLAESLREHFQRQGLRGLMEEELPEEELRELEELELEQLELEAEDLDGEELTEGEGPTEEGSEMPGAPGAKRRQRGSGRGGRGIARPGAGRGSGHGGRGGARVAAQGNTGGGGSGQAGRGRAQGPQGVREELLRRALRQRRQAQKMRNLSGGGREELSSDGKPPKATVGLAARAAPIPLASAAAEGPTVWKSRVNACGK